MEQKESPLFELSVIVGDMVSAKPIRNTVSGLATWSSRLSGTELLLPPRVDSTNGSDRASNVLG